MADDEILSVTRKENTFLDKDSTISLPRSLHEAYRVHMKRIDHPAVKLFSSSLQAHRSCNEAILFLYGVSGAGKSSTLNHLFSTYLIPTSATESSTDCVTEWVSAMYSEHWRVSDLEMGFVDVPGWGDSEGKDATNFALMQQFLSVHPILGCKLRMFYPNIVLLVFSSNDNRMLGSEANALKMLTSLSKLDIVDKKRPNVVIVLTHVCSHAKLEFSEKMEEQSLIYQSIARACLGVNPPVVWMENNPKYELERRGDWTVLYDGTEQPLNLYEAIRDLMSAAGDEIGKEAVRLYFGSRVINLPKERLIINPKLCDKKTLSKLEREWLNELRNDFPNFKSTTLNRFLQKFLSSHPELNIKEIDISQLLVVLASVYTDLSSIGTKDLSVIESRLKPYMLSIKEKTLPKERLSISPKLCDKKTLSKLEKIWLNELRSVIPNYKSTPLNRELQKFLSAHPELGIKEVHFPRLLLALASVYYTSSSIHSKDLFEIESRLKPYMLSIKEKVFLTRALNLKIHKSPTCIQGVGRGYNAVEELISSGDILEFTPCEKFCSSFNCHISEAFTILPFESRRISLGPIRHLSEFLIVKNLLKEMESRLNINSDALMLETTYSYITEHLLDQMGVNFWIETGLFDVQLKLPFVKLSQSFCGHIESLPNSVFTKDRKIRNAFSSLFQMYGHYIIIKASSGGLIGGMIPIKKFHSRDELLKTITPSLELYFDLIQDGYNWRDIQNDLSEQDISTLTELESSRLEWFGGDKSFISNTLKELTTEKYLKYLQSLKQSSILFDYSFSLVPIHQLVATKYPEKAKLVKQAFEEFLPNHNNRLYGHDDYLIFASLGNRMGHLPKSHSKQFMSLSETAIFAVPRYMSSSVTQQATKGRPQSTPIVSKQFLTRDEIYSMDKTDIKRPYNSCFSSESMVILKNGESIRMRELRIGDSVLSLNRRTNQPVFSKVYMWGHIDEARTASFLQIRHEHGTIRLTDNHLIVHGSDKRVTKAGNIQIGDVIHYFECNRDENESKSKYTLIPSSVTSVTRCVYEGVYSPFTENSSVVVDGVVCSVFAVPDDSVSQFRRFERISRIAFSPFILTSVCLCGDDAISKLPSENKLHPYPEFLLRVYNSVPMLRSYF